MIIPDWVWVIAAAIGLLIWGISIFGQAPRYWD